MRQLERACRQPKTAGCGSAFQPQRADQRDTGVVFTKNGYRFNGSKVDRRFSFSKIDAALRHNRNEERMGMTAKAHEAAIPIATPGTAQSELFNGSLGLLNGNGSSYNATDMEANQEMADILRRKKKRKRGFRL